MSVVQSWVHPERERFSRKTQTMANICSFHGNFGPMDGILHIPKIWACPKTSTLHYPTIGQTKCVKKKKCWNVMPNCWNVMPNCWKRRTRRCFQPIIVASITPPHPIKESRFPLVIIQDLPKLILWLFHVWKITNCSKLDSLTLNLWIRLKMSFING